MALLEQEAQCSQVLLFSSRQMLLPPFDYFFMYERSIDSLDNVDIGITFKEEPLSKRARGIM